MPCRVRPITTQMRSTSGKFTADPRSFRGRSTVHRTPPAAGSQERHAAFHALAQLGEMGTDVLRAGHPAGAAAAGGTGAAAAAAAAGAAAVALVILVGLG